MGRPKSKVAKVVVRGPLAPFSSAYRSRLAELGYTPLTMVNELRQVGHLSRWMVAADIAVADLTMTRLEGFLGERRTVAGSANCSLQGLRVLPALLHDLGVTRGAGPADVAGRAPCARRSPTPVAVKQDRGDLSGGAGRQLQAQGSCFFGQVGMGPPAEVRLNRLDLSPDYH